MVLCEKRTIVVMTMMVVVMKFNTIIVIALTFTLVLFSLSNSSSNNKNTNNTATTTFLIGAWTVHNNARYEWIAFCYKFAILPVPDLPIIDVVASTHICVYMEAQRHETCTMLLLMDYF